MKLLLLKDELDYFITSVKKSIFETHIKYRIENAGKELYWVHFDIDPNDTSILLSEIWRAGGFYYSKKEYKTS